MNTRQMTALLYECMESRMTVEEIVDEFSDVGVDVTEEIISEAMTSLKNSLSDITLADFDFDDSDSNVMEAAKKTVFLDIETSLLEARVWRTGKQNININQIRSNTRILTAAWGTMLDLKNKGEAGVVAVGNHMDVKAFVENPLDDTFVLKKLWHVLDEADVIVAHNASFDRGWIMGRFLEKGWKLPSKFDVVCTYSNLTEFNMTSKKLDELSKTLVGTKKKPTDFALWSRCSDGEFKAFEEMMSYNIGDIYNTLYKVYTKTCQYVPHLAVNLGRYCTGPTCTVTGDQLVIDGVYVSPINGLRYYLYINPNNGLKYIDRYNINSKKSNMFVKYFK